LRKRPGIPLVPPVNIIWDQGDYWDSDNSDKHVLVDAQRAFLDLLIDGGMQLT